MTALRLLDLFCGAGGAAMGYHRAGFEVIGVDIADHSAAYPFEFHQGDALTFPLAGFDAIHASPPCQAYTLMQAVNKNADAWPRLIEPIRDRLRATGKPYVIENVVGAPLEGAVWLCGSEFGLKVHRHRGFESNTFLMGAGGCSHHGTFAYGVYGDHPEDAPVNSRGGKVRRATTLAVGREAMGIDWMNWRQLCESIPPAYTQFIGEQLLAVLGVAA